VAYDARDAFGPRLRGWGRYARELLRALQAAGGLDYAVLGEGGRGPELWWEQVTLPRVLRRHGAAELHGLPATGDRAVATARDQHF